MNRYPKDWKAIANSIKEAARWRCAKCGMQCIKPGEDISKLKVKERRARLLQVHHSDYNTANSDPNNRASPLFPLSS
ncbi:HNH endonuclease [Crocosphaera sp. XPORK-15E]|uniref:HNH endonuclease n=1 Tax=Crocosphaera sp. XPORK-15E TaxID=3110247 RepID=UPI002B2053FD|nr:HNH endonuclease [Crocosphaera sp. XPORK-15E]MEA5537062.1 HNH endonuclease [Crocosphaera sp. XPORK-15E]